MSDNFEADQIAAAEMAKQDLNKFKAYFTRLKDLLGKDNGTIVLVDTENLGQAELDIYKKFVTFVKSLSEENCNIDNIEKISKELIAEAKACSNKDFSAWINNEIGPYCMIKFLASSWEGDGGNNKGVKFMVDYSIANSDPENLY